MFYASSLRSLYWGCHSFKLLCTKSLDRALLCATSVSSVSLWCGFTRNSSTTETQRTQRLHREIPEQELFVQSLTEIRNIAPPRIQTKPLVVRFQNTFAILLKRSNWAATRLREVVDIDRPLLESAAIGLWRMFRRALDGRHFAAGQSDRVLIATHDRALCC